MFSQLPYFNKFIEKESRLFRAVLDDVLYDITSHKDKERTEAKFWLHPDNNDFKEVCMYAQLSPLRTYNMFLFFLKNYFPKYLKELYCYQRKHGGIVKFSEDLTNLKSIEILNQITQLPETKGETLCTKNTTTNTKALQSTSTSPETQN